MGRLKQNSLTFSVINHISNSEYEHYEFTAIHTRDRLTNEQIIE